MRRRAGARSPRSTDRPFNVNFFCHAPPAPDAGARGGVARRAGAVLRRVRHRPRRDRRRRRAHARSAPRRPTCSKRSGRAVVSFHFGLPSPELLARVQALGREGAVVGDHRRRGALARGARRRRVIAQGARGRRPSRHVPVGRPDDADRHLRAGAADRARGEGAGDRRRRHRRRARRRGGAGARRRRRAGRHRLPAVPGGDDQRRSTAPR